MNSDNREHLALLDKPVWSDRDREKAKSLVLDFLSAIDLMYPWMSVYAKIAIRLLK